MYRLGLNQTKSDNYMFLDFDAPLCLSVSRNTGVVERLTPSILSAIKSRTLILLEGELPGTKTMKSEDGKTSTSVTSLEDLHVTKVTEEGIGTSEIFESGTDMTITFTPAVEPEKVAEAVEKVVEEPKKPTTKRSTKKAKAE